MEHPSEPGHLTNSVFFFFFLFLKVTQAFFGEMKLNRKAQVIDIVFLAPPHRYILMDGGDLRLAETAAYLNDVTWCQG